MKFVKCLLAAVLLLAAAGASHAAVRIADDPGGQIGSYITKFQRLHSSGQSVIIDGLCASACTIVLGAVPHDKICVTSRAALGFHAAYDFGINSRIFTRSPGATVKIPREVNPSIAPAKAIAGTFGAPVGALRNDRRIWWRGKAPPFEASGPEESIECLDEGILGRLAGSDVVPLDPDFMAPAQHRHVGQLGACL